MINHTTSPWVGIERWSPHLFLLAGVFLIIGALMSGFAFVDQSQLFDDWISLSLEFGRVAALVGTAGLSVKLMRQNTRLGKLSRGVASLAIVSTSVLIVWAMLNAAGLLSDPIPILGVGTYVLSVSTFLLYGVLIIRTRSHTRLVGALLIANVAALLVVFFGRLVLPLGLLAAAIPSFQALVYFGIGHRLRIDHASTRQTAPVSDTSP